MLRTFTGSVTGILWMRALPNPLSINAPASEIKIVNIATRPNSSGKRIRARMTLMMNETKRARNVSALRQIIALIVLLLKLSVMKEFD